MFRREAGVHVDHVVFAPVSDERDRIQSFYSRGLLPSNFSFSSPPFPSTASLRGTGCRVVDASRVRRVVRLREARSSGCEPEGESE